MSDQANENLEGPPERTVPRGKLASSTLGALRAGGRSAAPTEPAGAASEAAVETPVVETPLAESPHAEPPVPASEAERMPLELRKTDRSDEMPTHPVGAPTKPVDVVADVAPARSDGKPVRRGGWITVVCAVLAAAALVFAVVAGVVWWTAGHSGQHRLGIARDAVSTDARLAIVTVNTSDYRHPDSALTNWLDVSTGSLHTQFAQSRTAAVKLLAEAKMITKAEVLDAAVTSVDLSKGKASVIASVNVTRTPATGSVTTIRNRFRATLTRVDGTWKLSNLAVVAVSLS